MKLVEKNVWVKGCESGACVEVIDNGALVFISTTFSLNRIHVTYEEWEQFKQAVKDGKFD